MTVADPTAEKIAWPVWRLALVIVFGAFMSGLDASVVNVGLDTITRDLGTDLAAAQWVANGYLLALGVSLPVCGWLGRRVGVGRLWLAALAAFTVTSGLCALAGDIGWLIALRVAQGLSAGLLIPAGQTILGQAVGPGRLGRVMAVLGVAVTAAPALGPLVGGLVVQNASWPWLFLINLPIGAAGLALGLRYVPRGEPGDVGRLDRTGLVLLSTGLPLVVYGLTVWGERGGFSAPEVFVAVLGGLLALAVFGIHSRRTSNAVLDLGLFRNRTYAAAVTTAVFTGAAMFGAALLLPLYFQIGRGEGALATGLLLISSSLGTMLLLPLGGRLVDRYGGGPVAIVGGVASVVTTVPFALLPVDIGEPLVQLLLFLRGTATALAVMPASTAAYVAVTQRQLPDAITQVNIVMRVGGAAGGALLAVVLAGGLAEGVDPAFQAAFWLLTVASAAGLLGATWLALEDRSRA
jgi:EmrB/QacA subfamily drug resistance transporter